MKKRTLLTIASAALICAGAGAAFYLSGDEKDNSPTESNSTAAWSTESSPLRVSPSAERLIGARKVLAANVSPEIGRAFSISRSGPMRPPGNALKYVESLLPASQAGDAAATYEIFLATLECDNQWRSSGATYQEIDTGKSPIRIKSTKLEDRTNLLECEDLLTSESIQKNNWLEKAAQQGSVEAMIMYPINPDHVLGDPREYAMKPELVQKWKDDSVNYLQTAASLGSTDALYSLSDVYKNGIIAAPNPVEAYAYKLAALKATRNSTAQRNQTLLTEELTPKQIVDAETRSNQILNSCCTN